MEHKQWGDPEWEAGKKPGRKWFFSGVVRELLMTEHLSKDFRERRRVENLTRQCSERGDDRCKGSVLEEHQEDTHSQDRAGKPSVPPQRNRGRHKPL